MKIVQTCGPTPTQRIWEPGRNDAGRRVVESLWISRGKPQFLVEKKTVVSVASARDSTYVVQSENEGSAAPLVPVDSAG
jgi:hypothetical protein